MPQLTSNAVLCITAGLPDGTTTFEDTSEGEHSIYSSGAEHSDDAYFLPPTSIKLEAEGIISVSEILISTIGTSNFSFEFRNVEFGDGTVSFSSSSSDGSDKTFTVLCYKDSTAYYASVLLFDAAGPTWTYADFNTTGVIPSDGDHVYFARVSGQLRLYVNGVLRGYTTCTWNIASADSQQFQIESLGGGCFIDQIVVWNNAHWTSNFTPPTDSYDNRIHIAGDINAPVSVVSSVTDNPIEINGSINSPVASFHGVVANPISINTNIYAPVPVITAAGPLIGYGAITAPKPTINSSVSFPAVINASIISKKISLFTDIVNKAAIIGNIRSPKVDIRSRIGDNNCSIVTQVPTISATLVQRLAINCGIETSTVIQGTMNNKINIGVGIEVDTIIRGKISQEESTEIITYNKDRRCNL